MSDVKARTHAKRLVCNYAYNETNIVRV